VPKLPVFKVAYRYHIETYLVKSLYLFTISYADYGLCYHQGCTQAFSKLEQ